MTDTDGLHLVAMYTGMSFSELMLLDCFTFKMLIRDSYISKLRQSEEGREYLENCWLMKQTEPDRNTLRREFKDA